MTRGAPELDALIPEEIEVTIEPNHIDLLRVGEISRDVVDRVARVGPPRRLHLVVLHDQGRVGELPDIAPVVQVHVTDRDVLDVRDLEPDLGELGRDGVVLRHLQSEALGQRAPPSVGVGDRLVVVAGVEHHVALGMRDHVEGDGRPVDIALAADLERPFREASQRARREDVELHACRALRQRREAGEKEKSRQERAGECLPLHDCPPEPECSERGRILCPRIALVKGRNRPRADGSGTS